jgi:hypothetical protein
MRKNIIRFCVVIFLIAGAAALFNIETTTRQGINFEVSVIKIPLYLKVLDFFDRHYNYQNLVRKIINPSDSREERVIKIFCWTYNNIKRVPAGYPVVDDHVWHIIVRGYGLSDQSQDVFTTLCNYAGIDAFFESIYTKDGALVKPLSFVRLDRGWRVFDVYEGVYFKNKHGGLASIEEIKNQNWIIFDAMGLNKQNLDYAKCLENLPLIKDIGLRRANIQSPFKRLLFELEYRSGILKR